MKKSLIILSGLLMCLLSACSKSNNAELYQEIKSIDKLVLAKMSITKTVVKNSRWKVGGRRIAGYSYDTYARAFIDLSSLQTEDLIFDDENKTVKVYLPPVVAELFGRDTELREVYNHITGVRDDMEEKDITILKEDGNTDMLKEWNENPMFKSHLINAAQRKARKYFENIFETNGYVASIEFKNSINGRNEIND